MDKDNDGFLNDEELVAFQSDVFNKRLTRNHLTAFKELIVNECDDYDESKALRGINFEALKTFNRILISKLKMETCWTILRYFGYGDNLRLNPSLYSCASISEEDLAESRAVELK